ncbi:hypothetical protein [Streptomyces brasiliensis]|uniref:Two-component sensor histidine kinase n=1 Tax=Streptomyces brasiliensis TaxID=1954 RepID=A0A917KZ38_9ACTN|nr:hypothetical protein [Streptomyces brasiliensis]GGJ34191.1 hypothetical protein GCM10010121_051760 [Streptomyces brasiliensis]
MPIVRGLLNPRSVRWKTIFLVTLACAAMALTVGVLVHESTLKRSMHEGAGKAAEALTRAIQDARNSGEAPPLAAPGDLPDPLLRQVRLHGEGTFYEDKRYARPQAPGRDDGEGPGQRRTLHHRSAGGWPL